LVFYLGGTFLVVLGISLVILGGVMCLEELISHGLTHLSLGAYPLGGNLHNGVAILSFIHLVPGDSYLGLVLGILFL